MSGAPTSASTSLERLEEIFDLCKELGILTEPTYTCGAIVAPIVSWHHQSWDSEPDIKGWHGIPPVELAMSDYHRCKWPSPLSMADDSVARYMDVLNDKCALCARVNALRQEHPHAPLITFSHFVPRVEVC